MDGVEPTATIPEDSKSRDESRPDTTNSLAMTRATLTNIEDRNDCLDWLICFDENDKENPRMWPKWKRVACSLSVTLAATILCVPYGHILVMIE